MFCPKCNNEIVNNVKFCTNCGVNLTDTINMPNTKTKHSMKKILGIICIGIAVIVAVVVFRIIDGQPPKEEQIKLDLINEMFSSRDVVISDFSIQSRITEEKQDSVIASVICSNEEVEYREEYVVGYYKKDDWVLTGIEEFKKELWEVYPLSVPTAEECREEVLGRLHEEFDEFKVSKNQVKADPKEKVAVFNYEVKKDTLFIHITGEIQCEYIFDTGKEEWICYDITYGDSYRKEYDFPYIWYGMDEDVWRGNTEFELQIIDSNMVAEAHHSDYGNVTAEIRMNGKTQRMEGVIEYVGGGNLSINVRGGENDSYCLEGVFSEPSGEFSGTLYTAYDPERVIYFGGEFFRLSLNIK